MSNVIQSVEELIDQTPDRDNQETFHQLWNILGELRSRIEGRFELKPDESTLDLASYKSQTGEGQGALTALSGSEIDWMIHSFFGTPAQSFSNMHLTTWLGPQIKVPHFGMALGTIPDLFVYLDYVPRVDIMTDLDYLDRYYEDQNRTFLDFEGDDEFKPFVSRTVYMRQAQSNCSLCYVAKPTAENIEKVKRAAHTMMDRWLQWVDAAPKVPVEEQAELAARDLLIRKTISDRDPANVMGEKIVGKELTERLVGTLWGEGRKSPRAGSWQQ